MTIIPVTGRILLTAYLCLMALALAHPGSRASAQTFGETREEGCETFPFTGVWETPDPKLNELSRLTVETECEGTRLVSIRVKAETLCYPRDCSFGWADHINITGPARMEAVFFTFSAARTYRMAPAGNQMLVDVEHNYNQPGRSTGHETATLRRVD